MSDMRPAPRSPGLPGHEMEIRDAPGPRAPRRELPGMLRRARALSPHVRSARASAALTRHRRHSPSGFWRGWRRRIGVGAGWRGWDWSYAAALPVCVGAALLWASQPGPRAMLESLSSMASRRVIEATTFVLHSLAFGVLSLASSWGWISIVVDPVAPVVRAIGSLLSQPAIQAALAMAAVTCALVLWWMRPRERKGKGGVRHVAVLL